MEPLADRSADVVRPPAPSGLVTFVFTDGEGSTRLLREHGDAYVDLLDHHHRVLRDAWRRHEGYEFFTEGDAFGVAFASVDQALAACLDAQWHLQNEPWPNGIRMPVRMGVHTGLAAPRHGDYIALAVNQVARVVGAAHGDQIVVTSDAIDNDPRATTETLRPLGLHRVRDFDAPIMLFQANGEGPPRVFPPLRVARYEQHNIPRPLTSLIGRTAEISALGELMQPGRLVSIVGPGGVGKTRLATEVALRAATDWDDGVWLVELAPLAHPEEIPAALADALGFAPARDADLEASLRSFLRDKSMLLVLDNSEHLRAAVTTLVTRLRQQCPSLGVLVTGREPLGAPGELTVLLPPLPTSADQGGVPDAVSLFMERSAALGVARHTRASELESVRELCRRLDGLPLAIEMAAARSTAFSPDEIIDALIVRARAQPDHDGTDNSRHRSLDELFAWSEVLLDDDERFLLHALTVFADGFASDGAAAAATGGLEHDTIPDLLWRLVNRSLVFVDQQPDTTRFRLLETVRELLRRRIPRDRQLQNVARLGRWMVSRVGPGATLDRAWAHEMAQELNNVRHLIGELATFDQPTAQRLAWSVLQYHGRIVDNAEHGRNHRDGAKEGLRFLELLPEPSQDRVGLLVETAWLHQFINDVDAAQALLDEASSLLSEVGRPTWKPFYLERVAAEVAAMTGDLIRAGRIAETALGEAGDADSRGALLDIAAHVRFEHGDLTGAAECYEAEAHLWSQIGEEAKAACAHGSLAEVLLVAGDPHGAARAQSRCLDVALQLGAQREVAYSLHLAARLATLDEAWQQAATFAVVGDEQLSQIGASMYPTDRVQADRVISACQSELGVDGFDEVARLAASRDLGEVIAEAAAFLSTYHHPTKESQHAPTTA